LSLKDRIALYERQAPILEAVAKRYDEKSPEYTAIKQASIALWYALSQLTMILWLIVKTGKAAS